MPLHTRAPLLTLLFVVFLLLHPPTTTTSSPTPAPDLSVPTPAPTILTVAALQYFPLAPPPNTVPTRAEAVALAAANIAQLSDGVARAAAAGAQLVVLPEDSLFGDLGGSTARPPPTPAQATPFLDPVPAAAATPVWPCTNRTLQQTAPSLSALACVAATHRVHLVAWIGDRTADGQQFNTQIFLDSSGRLLAKYHKIHLFAEPQFDAGPDTPANHVAVDMLGTRIGASVCFDLMFPTPMPALVASQNVRLFVSSLWWVNQPPIGSMESFFLAWSFMHQATIIAAGSAQDWGFVGSGVFASGRLLNARLADPTLGIRGHPPDVVTAVLDIPASNWSGADPGNGHARHISSSAAGGGRGRKLNAGRSGQNTPPLSSSAPSVTKFTATAGSHNIIYASAGTLECSAGYRIQQQAAAAEVYALVAYTGVYVSFFEGLCALVKCTDLSAANGCYDEGFRQQSANYAGTVFSYASIGASNIPAGLSAWPLAAANASVPLSPADDLVLDANPAAATATLTANAAALARAPLLGLSLLFNRQFE